MRAAIAVLPLLAACGQAAPPQTRPTDRVKMFDLADGTAERDGDYGGRVPMPPRGGVPAGHWRVWAEQAWPATCRALRTRIVTATVLRVGRDCRLEAVLGDVPVATMRSRGVAIADGTRYPIGWSWRELRPLGEAAACAADPMPNGPVRLRLVRSGDTGRWSAMPLDADTGIADDDVRRTCADLPRFLGPPSR